MLVAHRINKLGKKRENPSEKIRMPLIPRYHSVRRPEAGLAPRFFGSLSGKPASLYDSPGQRRPHSRSQRGASSGIRTPTLLFRRLTSKSARLPSLPVGTKCCTQNKQIRKKRENPSEKIRMSLIPRYHSVRRPKAELAPKFLEA